MEYTTTTTVTLYGIDDYQVHMEIQCGECGNEYEATFDESSDNCPECGFGPDKCSHPVSYRESEWIYDAGEGQDVERVYCGKCGEPL